MIKSIFRQHWFIVLRLYCLHMMIDWCIRSDIWVKQLCCIDRIKWFEQLDCITGFRYCNIMWMPISAAFFPHILWWNGISPVTLVVFSCVFISILNFTHLIWKEHVLHFHVQYANCAINICYCYLNVLGADYTPSQWGNYTTIACSITPLPPWIYFTSENSIWRLCKA